VDERGATRSLSAPGAASPSFLMLAIVIPTTPPARRIAALTQLAMVMT
jgi:hypothetical protein